MIFKQLRSYSFLLIVGLAQICGPNMVQAQEVLNSILDAEKIRVGVSGNQPPFSMEASDGSIIGYEVDLVNMLGDAMNVRIELVQMAFPDLLPALEEGKLDIVVSGISMTTERNMRVAFAGPYLVTGKSLLTKNMDFANRTNARYLNDKKIRIATLRGSTSQDYVRAEFPKAKLTVVGDYDEAVEMLRKDEIDVMIADYAQCTYASFKYSEDHFHVMKNPMTSERIGMAVTPRDPLFINLITNFFDNLRESGVFQDLEEEWFLSGSWLNRVK